MVIIIVPEILYVWISNSQLWDSNEPACQLVLLSGHVPAAQDRNKMHVADCVCQPVADKHSVTAERIQQHLELMLSSGGIFVSHHPEV